MHTQRNIIDRLKIGRGLWSRRLLAQALVLILILGSGCARKVPGTGQRLDQARYLAGTGQGFEETRFDSQPFDLFGFTAVPDHCRGKKIHLYIEGDGLAWLTPTIASKDPTPLNPGALKLAVQDPNSCKIYLARPCQYILGTNCQKPVWTARRFSKGVIQSYHRVMDLISERFQPSSFVVFGYSGGGAVAAILAAQRQDISKLVTVAGNLDTDFWTTKHHLSPLTGSLNPADFAGALEKVDQYHFMGGQDKNMDQTVFFSFANKFANKENLHYKIMESFDHSCCWDRAWKAMLKQIGE